MFDIGLTANDLKRVAWSALFGAAASIVAGATDWQIIAGAAVAAALAAIKNGVLSDSSKLKG